ncbi:F0F1 ATP synthase subunit B [Candidatus Peribacteria bacterium]|nr:MAG: F0F1 ATP synthase subunit B [Candidatus Peribacteria bacterium]
MEIIETLGIDWQLLLAQIINFGIVLVLLMKFVYKPLLRVIDARRDAIRRSMEEAAEIDRQNKKMEETRKEKLQLADKEAGAILERAKQEADALRADTVINANKEAEQIIAKGEKQLEQERARVFGEVQEAMTASIIKLSEEIIRREFTKEDQARLMKHIEKELPALMKL